MHKEKNDQCDHQKEDYEKKGWYSRRALLLSFPKRYALLQGKLYRRLFLRWGSALIRWGTQGFTALPTGVLRGRILINRPAMGAANTFHSHSFLRSALSLSFYLHSLALDELYSSRKTERREVNVFTPAGRPSGR
jgi:hypothetical protein